MLEIASDNLVFNFPEVHPDAKLTISLIRTLRIPDDNKRYALPPGLGTFPVRHVDDFKNRVPSKWVKHGGVLIPMYQSEAMWLSFRCSHSSLRQAAYPFAIKVATGKRSALTGGPWSKSLKDKDYMVAPTQPWLDGYVIADGVIRQFVAAPLGQGFTAEEQITGKAEFGGLQIEVMPMKRNCFERRYPERPASHRITRSRKFQTLVMSDLKFGSSGLYSEGLISDHDSLDVDYARGLDTVTVNCCAESQALTEISEMGLAPGGTMNQQIFADSFGISEWDTDSKNRCFIHLVNSMTWRAITDEAPPTVPFTAADYTRHGYAWFDYYRDDLKVLKGTSTLKGLKSVAKMGKKKGINILPENTSVIPKHIIKLGKHHGVVRDGVWK